MRFLFLAAPLALAACTTAPAPAPRTQRPVSPPPPAPAVVQQSGTLIGLTAAQLTQRFGAADLTVAEGQGLKLQYRGQACVLDTYLYPQAGQRAATVVHVDARDRLGNDVNREACTAALDAAR